MRKRQEAILELLANGTSNIFGKLGRKSDPFLNADVRSLLEQGLIETTYKITTKGLEELLKRREQRGGKPEQ